MQVECSDETGDGTDAFAWFESREAVESNSMSQKQSHPSDEQLCAFSLGQLPPGDAADVENHISNCKPCCDTLLGISTDDTFVKLLKEGKVSDDGLTVDQAYSTSVADTQTASSIPAALAEHPRYRIVELIAKGGMGDVFKAEHRVMERTVAIKVIRQELMRKTEAVERFHREVKTAAKLSHSHIVTAYDAEQAGGVHFLVMEHVEGVDLAHLVKQQGALPVAKACEYIRQSAFGLQYAHERGMVHRDVKPHNLMVTEDGTVKILDFGLASLATASYSEQDDSLPTCADLTAVGTVMGTPDFISPEQAEDAHQADIRSDIYSLGTTLYYLLSGQAPFAEGSVMHKLKSHAEIDPEPIQHLQVDVPDELADVLRRMMAKKPEDRYQTPAEVAEALAPFVDRHGDELSQNAPPLQVDRSRRLPRSMAMCILATAALLVAGVIFHVVTNRGTLVIESDDPNIEIAVRRLAHGSPKWEYRIADLLTGSTVKQLGTGAYLVDLQGRDNEFEISPERFILKRGDKVVVKVTRREDSDLASGGTRLSTETPQVEKLPANMPSETTAQNTMQASGLAKGLRYNGLDTFIHHLDVSSDGKWLLAGSGNPNCMGMVWDFESGEIVSRYDQHQSMIFRNVFTPDNRLVAMAHWDGTVTLWDPKTGERRGAMYDHDGRLEFLAVSPDGKWLATGTTSFADAHSLGNNEDVSFRIFDIATQKLVYQHNFVTDEAKHGGVWELQFSPDGSKLLVAVELSPDAKLDSDNSGFVDEFEVGTWKKRRRLCSAPDDGSKVRSLRYSPDGNWIATGHQALDIPNERWWDDPANSVIRLWDARTFELSQTLRGHRGSIRTIDFSPDSRLVVSCNGYQWKDQVAVEAIQYTVRLWDINTGVEIGQARLDETIQCVRFAPDGRSVVTGSGGLGQESVIQRWSLPGTVLESQANRSDSGSNQKPSSGQSSRVWAVAGTTLIDAPRNRFAFVREVTRDDVIKLVADIADGHRLWFYDEQYDSASDPGAFVTLVRTEGKLFATWNNHGWSMGWVPLSEEKAVAYVWACRRENMVGVQNAIKYVGMERGVSHRIPSADDRADDATAGRCLRHIEARIDESEKPKQKG